MSDASQVFVKFYVVLFCSLLKSDNVNLISSYHAYCLLKLTPKGMSLPFDLWSLRCGFSSSLIVVSFKAIPNVW